MNEVNHSFTTSLHSALPRLYFIMPEDPRETNPPQSLDYGWELFGDIWGLNYLMYFIMKSFFPITPTRALPTDGILFGHSGLLPKTRCISNSCYEVCLQFDYPRSPFSHFTIAPNRHSAHFKNLTLPTRFFWPRTTIFLPHMSQIGLKPRSANLGLRLDNISYFGLEKNMNPILLKPSFINSLGKLNMFFNPVFDPAKWTDYSNVDAVVAIREDDSLILNKPAQKLYNCWLAGVVPIMGMEQGFREEGKAGVDYLEIRNSNEAIDALSWLKNNPSAHASILKSGEIRARELTPTKIAAIWIDAVKSTIIPDAQKWLSKPSIVRKSFILFRLLREKIKTIRKSSFTSNEKPWISK
jgi:hypothetical protein